eukprot:6176721-Pleurochrysis_carterae.AAC.1
MLSEYTIRRPGRRFIRVGVRRVVSPIAFLQPVQPMCSYCCKLAKHTPRLCVRLQARNVPTEYNEGKYIAVIIVNLAQ